LPSEKESAIMESPESYSGETERKYTIEAVIESQIFLFNKNEFEEAAFQHRVFTMYTSNL
jgi:hypothetical protein